MADTDWLATLSFSGAAPAAEGSAPAAPSTTPESAVSKPVKIPIGPGLLCRLIGRPATLCKCGALMCKLTGNGHVPTSLDFPLGAVLCILPPDRATGRPITACRMKVSRYNETKGSFRFNVDTGHGLVTVQLQLENRVSYYKRKPDGSSDAITSPIDDSFLDYIGLGLDSAQYLASQAGASAPQFTELTDVPAWLARYRAEVADQQLPIITLLGVPGATGQSVCYCAYDGESVSVYAHGSPLLQLHLNGKPWRSCPQYGVSNK